MNVLWPPVFDLAVNGMFPMLWGGVLFSVLQP